MGKFAIAMVMVVMNYSFKGDLIIAKRWLTKTSCFLILSFFFER